VAKRLSTLGAEAAIKSPIELSSFLRDDIKKWAAVVKSSGAKAE
jgi:tripartite-type tricarboxylate transporter receptor subunit TctC